MKKQTILLLVLILIYLTLIEIPKQFLNTNALIYNSLSEQFGNEQVLKILSLQKKWEWVGYLIVPIIVLIKTILIATVLYIGIAFTDAKITFISIFNKVVQAEFIFLLVPIFKIIWFYFFQTNYKLEDIQYFFPFSAINITGYEGLEPWFIYPLQTLNLFELAYIIYLGYQMGKLTNTNPDKGIKIVVSSYVPALVLWICTVMFLTLNYS